MFSELFQTSFLLFWCLRFLLLNFLNCLINLLSQNLNTTTAEIHKCNCMLLLVTGQNDFIKYSTYGTYNVTLSTTEV